MQGKNSLYVRGELSAVLHSIYHSVWLYIHVQCMVSAVSSNRAKLVPAFFILVFCAWHTAGSWYVSAECTDECWVKTKLSIRCCGKAEEGACELWPGDRSASL